MKLKVKTVEGIELSWQLVSIVVQTIPYTYIVVHIEFNKNSSIEYFPYEYESAEISFWHR